MSDWTSSTLPVTPVTLRVVGVDEPPLEYHWSTSLPVAPAATPPARVEFPSTVKVLAAVIPVSAAPLNISVPGVEVEPVELSPQ